MDLTIECDICNGNADSTFKRIEVWKNDTWRMTMSKYSDVRGFCYLEPRRHIESITDLDGIEAAEFGTVLASLTSALKRATGVKLVYVYIYGDHIKHLHVHLAPHVDGDLYCDDVVKSGLELSETELSDDEQKRLCERIYNEIS